MCLLAGKISQHILLGKTYSKVLAEDIEQAKKIIHALCADPLLTKDEVLKQSHELEQELHTKIQELLYTNKGLVEKIYKALLIYETLDRDMLKTFAAQTS
jgi:ATP-dependent Zn protease